ncbi:MULTISPECIES: peptidoglycan editing factor PgeF [unclassified Agarivorans]|uniref:peptidoglycan editing factor PgeF n=1 Tax=unclassified Agarivorans TaxID=2636026 RepID=UPI003D7EFD1E
MPSHLVEWPCPPNVRAIFSDRLGGVSQAPFDSFNLGDHVGDARRAVQQNRVAFQAEMPDQVCWLKQIHSTQVVDASLSGSQMAEADASVSDQPGAVCVVMTADCLPILLCDKQGRVVAAVHAGWRGLANGIIENTIAKMKVAPKQVMAWMGPAIGPSAFEVGEEVKQAFVDSHSEAYLAFTPSNKANKYFADIFMLAEQRLTQAGLTAVYSERCCTYRSAQQFYSYRREGLTGRMAAAIWLEE